MLSLAREAAVSRALRRANLSPALPGLGGGLLGISSRLRLLESGISEPGITMIKRGEGVVMWREGFASAETMMKHPVW